MKSPSRSQDYSFASESPPNRKQKVAIMSNTSVDDKTVVDYISSLPDALVCRILGFLPTKYSVRTSILSRRWRYVWTQVPAIDFSDLDLSHQFNSLLNEEQTLRFNNFITWFLLRMDVSYLVRCKIPLHYNDDPLQINSWLDAIKLHKIGELDMRYKVNNNPIRLPRQFLSCQALIVLKLEWFCINDTPPSFHLPKLETVHFGRGTVFPDDLFLKRFLSGCPIIKELHIYSSQGIHNTLYVESFTLRSLDLSYITRRKTDDDNPGLCVDIYAPNLRSLRLRNALAQYNIGDLDFLTDANIDIRTNFWVHSNFYHNTLRQLMIKVSRVTSLQFAIYDLGSFGGELSTFENLSHLTLIGDGCTYDLLQYAPNLKFLSFKQIGYAHKLYEFRVVPQCFSCLEIVELLLEFHPLVREDGKRCLLKVAEYILKATPALKEMIVVNIGSIGYTRTKFNGLLKFPCSSPRCQVKFLNRRGMRPKQS